MILLHLYKADSEILINPKYILYVEYCTNFSKIHYSTNCDKVNYITVHVKETPKEIQELINNFYIPF